MPNSSGEPASMPRNAIGRIQSETGSISVVRLGDFMCQSNAGGQSYAGDYLYQGDVIETGADSSVEISFNDGTTFTLSADARLVLDELVCGSDGTVHSALFTLARGAFAFSADRLSAAGYLRIDTPIASLRGWHRGTGIVTLSLAALAFSLLRDARDAQAFSTDDDTITLKDSEYGTFEIVTKSGTVIVADDPGLTYLVDEDGSVARIPNSSARMEELQLAQQAVLGTYSRGVQGPSGSNSPLDFQETPDSALPLIPINFQPLDPIPERIEPVFPLHVDVMLQFPGPPPDPPAPAPPVIRAFTFDSGIDGDRITNNNALVLIGTAEPGTVVTIFDDGMRLGSSTTDGTGNWSFDTGPLADGEHAFSAAAGAPSTQPATARSAFAAFAIAPESNTGPASAPYIVIIDTTPPKAPVITAFAEHSGGPTQDTAPTLTITAEAGSTVHIYRNDLLIGTATETAIAGVFSFTSEELEDGRYTFAATATDIANNTSALSCEFKIEIDGTAPLAPVIKLAHKCDCPEDNLTEDVTPTLMIAAEAGSTVHVYRDGMLFGTATETGKDGLFTFTAEELADGSYSFTTATDKAGNTSPLSTEFAIAIITSDPNDFDSLPVGDCLAVDPDGTVHGTSGSDTIRFKDYECESGRTIYAGAGHDKIDGTDQNDTIYGGSGNDRINGNCGDDTIFGGFGADAIYGANGNDMIVGGYGSDFLSGGKGHDTFVFLSVIDSPPCQPDTISDFESRCDRIDLSAIDANADQAEDQAFNFIGETGAYTVIENSVSWYYDFRTDKTYVLADTDGDAATAEFEIALAGRVSLNQDNFVL